MNIRQRIEVIMQEWQNGRISNSAATSQLADITNEPLTTNEKIYLLDQISILWR